MTRTVALSVALGAAGGAAALDPHLAITQLSHTSWQDELPQNTVHSIIQSRDGYIWLGTYEGLVRFDGARFVTFDQVRSRDLPGSTVHHLAEDEAGRLWVSTNGGLVRLEEGVFTTFGPEHGLPSQVVKASHPAADGSLWVGTDRGLCRLVDGLCEPVTAAGVETPASVWALEVDLLGTLWVATDRGLFLLSGGAWARLGAADGLPHELCTALAASRDGSVWVGTNGGVARLREGRVVATLTPRDGLPDPFVRALWEDNQGSLWVGTEDSGLSRLAQGQVTTFGSRQGLTSDYVRSIAEDREGSLWVGTNGGLNQLHAGKVRVYTAREGLAHDFARTILADRDGSVWVGTDGGGLSRFRDGHFETLSIADGLSSASVRALCQGRDGSIWIGTRAGLDRWDGRRMKTLSTADGLSSNLVRAVLEDRQGTIWVGTEGRGLNRLGDDGSVTVLTTADGLAGNDVRALYEDREGTLWVGTFGGLSRLEGGSFSTYRTTDGLPSNIVFVVTQDSHGRLWVGTEGGLALLRDGRLTAIDVSHGLYDNKIFQILEDDLGYLWTSSNRGISRVAVDDLVAVAEGRAEQVEAIGYNRADGMKVNQCNGASQPAGCTDSNGRLWFPTARGVVVIDPERLGLNPLAPPVVLEEVLVDGAQVDARHLDRLPAGNRELELHYAGLSFLSPDKVRFRYILEGFDRRWAEAGTRRTAYYTNVPPGDYRFRVVACNNDGVWNEIGAEWAFTVATPLWQTWWAYLLYLAAAALAVASGVRLRLSAVTRQNQALEARVADRTAEVEDTNRALAVKIHELEISEQRALESEQRALESEQRALEASRAKSVFLSNMSHELRTPLNSIIGFATILTEKLRGRIEGRYEKFLLNILGSGQHLLGLINNILDLSKIEAGRMEFFPDRVDLRQVFGDVVDVMKGVAAEQKVTIAVEAPDDLPFLTADLGKVKQIMFNLLSNAVKFSPRGATVTVRAALVEADSSPLEVESVRVEVVDRGIGIKREDLELIFEEFRQVDDGASRRYQGTGLGLTLVRKLLNMHGGRVEVDSELGRGSTFTVFLPLRLRGAGVPALRDSGEPAAAPVEAASPPARGRTILVVEDEPTSLHALAAALEQEGYRVLGARTGEQALQLLESERPALVSLDIVLPGMAGWDILKEIKSRHATRDIPVLIVTVLENRELGLALGADDFFTKPVDRAAFVQRVRELAPPLDPPDGERAILVIDDDPAVHDLLEAELEPAGYSVLTAANGPDGLALARSRSPALIVLDLMMPGMNGFEVAVELRSDPRTARLPVVVLTAKDLTAADRQALSGKIATVIPKGDDAVARVTRSIRDLLARP